MDKRRSQVDWNSSAEAKAAYVNDFKWFCIQVKVVVGGNTLKYFIWKYINLNDGYVSKFASIKYQGRLF